VKEVYIDRKINEITTIIEKLKEIIEKKLFGSK